MIDKMGPSILAYPALQIHDAIKNGTISVKLSDASMMSPHLMSYAQGRVLFQGLLQNNDDKNNSSDSGLNEFIMDYFFSIPSLAIIISQHNEQGKKLENMEKLLNYYDKLLPAQRYALLWALVQRNPTEFEDILAVLSVHDITPQTDPKNKPYSLLRLATPRVFEKYSSML